MRLLFVMDPYGTMHPEKDTSFAFLRGAQKLGHRSWHCEPKHISVEGSRVFATARPIRVQPTAPFFVVEDPEILEVEGLDAVLIRKDPPVDADYLHLTHQLDLVTRHTLVLNDPRALRDANEKLYALHFAEFMPRTLVSSSSELLLDFLQRVGGEAVIKPLDGAGGSGVIGLRGGDRNSRGIIDYMTSEGRHLAMIQEFQPDVIHGDKRVLLLDGRLLGTIRRVPREDDIRANIHVGGRVELAELTKEENELVERVGPRLAEAGLYFVGLDLIAGKLIEINVTSPTGIQELGRLTGTEPELDVIRWLEQRISRTSASA